MRYHEMDQACAANHIEYGCPESEWAEGRTLFAYFQDRLNNVTVYRTPGDAQAGMDKSKGWNDKQIRTYEELGIPVPPKYYEWRYEIR